MADLQNMPVVSDDMQAGILAAIKRAESVPVGDTLIDTMSKEDWLSDDAQDWNINVGSPENTNEIDAFDSEVDSAA